MAAYQEHPQHPLPLSLLQLLSNTIVLYQTAPYLPIYSLLALGGTSKAFQALIYHTPGVFRHLDLHGITSAQTSIGSIDHGGQLWRNVQLDENVTEDDFYGGPLRGIFNKLRHRNILLSVQTLILDGLTVPVDLVTEILTNDTFNVRILSLREVRHLNERKLQQAIMYAIRPTRAPNTPKIQGLYIFGPMDTSSTGLWQTTKCQANPEQQVLDPTSREGTGQASSPQRSGNGSSNDGNQWFERTGRIFAKEPDAEWSHTIRACQGIISFDAVLCQGPSHLVTISEVEGSKSAWYTSPRLFSPPRVATHALRGCNSCGKSPEALATINPSTIDMFPLMAPVPLHSSTTRIAKIPAYVKWTSENKLLVRCSKCLKNRYCECCHKWWCEDCYQPDSQRQTVPQTPTSADSEKHIESKRNKVHVGLCTETCLKEELTRGAGMED